MSTIFSNRIQSTILVVTLIFTAFTSICNANTNSLDDVTSITIPKGTFVTPKEINDTTRITIAKGKFVNPAEMIGVLQPIGATKMVESEEISPLTALDSLKVFKSDDTRINTKDSSYISVKSAPSENSRTIALVKSGQAVKVLKAKDSWMKITWQIDNTLNQGWLKKTYVEGKSIHAHR
jgi:hypothetical protein